MFGGKDFYSQNILHQLVAYRIDSEGRARQLLHGVPQSPLEIFPMQHERSLSPNSCQELLHTRLAMGIVEREDDDVTMEKLDKALGELFEKKVRGHLNTEWMSLTTSPPPVRFQHQYNLS